MDTYKDLLLSDAEGVICPLNNGTCQDFGHSSLTGEKMFNKIASKTARTDREPGNFKNQYRNCAPLLEFIKAS